MKIIEFEKLLSRRIVTILDLMSVKRDASAMPSPQFTSPLQTRKDAANLMLMKLFRILLSRILLRLLMGILLLTRIKLVRVNRQNLNRECHHKKYT